MRKQWKLALQASLVSIACLLLAGCVVFAELFFGIAPAKDLSSRVGVSLPELSGPYPVGRRYFDWVDRSRRDPFDRSADRELVVSLWYPAQVSGTPEAGTYLPGEWGRLAGRYQSMLLRIRGQSFLSALVRDPLPRELIAGIRTHAAEGAVISGDRPSFPVLLFSPGFGAMPTEYTALLEDVASHGYIVAGINPTDFVPITVFEDGRIAHAPLWDFSLYDPEKDYPVWVRDMLFVLTQLFEQNRDPKSPLFSHLDMTSVGAFGHSFGGAASAGACHFDPRIRAGMNLDGAPQGDRSTWKFRQPFLLVQSEPRAYRDSADEEFYDGLTTGYRVVIKGSTHHAFTDEAVLPLPANRRKALVGSIPGPRMVRITSFLVCSFFDRYLQSKDSAILEDAHSRFPEIIVSRHNAATN